MAAITIFSDFGAQKNKVSHCFPIYLPWSGGTRCHDLSFWILSFKPTFSLSSFIKKLFSSSSLSAIRVVSSVYLRLLIFLPAIYIPSCASSSPAFLIMYSTHKLKSRFTIYSLDIRLSQFGTSLLFHVQFWLLLIDLYTDFSGGGWGGLVFPYLSEFSAVCCDPHSQRLLHSH